MAYTFVTENGAVYLMHDGRITRTSATPVRDRGDGRVVPLPVGGICRFDVPPTVGQSFEFRTDGLPVHTGRVVRIYAGWDQATQEPEATERHGDTAAHVLERQHQAHLARSDDLARLRDWLDVDAANRLIDRLVVGHPLVVHAPQGDPVAM